MISRLLIFLLLFLSFHAWGQIWAPNGANWTYTVCPMGAPCGYIRLSYTSDTLVNSILCKKLTKVFHGNFEGDIKSIYYQAEYTYEENGVVYLFNKDHFDTLYNFKASIGDYWKMARPPEGIKDTLNQIMVLDTGRITINSTSLKMIKVQFIYQQGFNRTDTIIEKIGVKNSYFLPYDFLLGMIDGNEGGPFRCYSDNNFATYKPAFKDSCDYIQGISNLKNEGLMKIYPNPVNDIVFVQTEEQNLKYLLYSIDGKLVKNGDLSLNKIDVSNLQKGLYVLTVINKNNFLVIHKKISIQ